MYQNLAGIEEYKDGLEFPDLSHKVNLKIIRAVIEKELIQFHI
jgi:hypothetical protein